MAEKLLEIFAMIPPTGRERLERIRQTLRGQRISEPNPFLEFKAAATEAGLLLNQPYGAIPTGDFVVPLVQVVAPALGGVIVGWLQAGAGRRVRVKIGDAEAEARSVAEVQQLLDLISTHQSKKGTDKADRSP